MIFAERKPMDEILENLTGFRKILVVGCATCVAECAVGGENEVETLAPLISLAFKKKGVQVEMFTATLEKQCEYEFVEEIAEKVHNADVVLSLACGIGVQAVAERFPDKLIYPGVNTSALTIREEAGIWASRCAACGDCTLGDTLGFCPVARCAKSLMNGPCGGTRKDGKCEINEETDCVWSLIVERAESRGELDSISKISKPRDWSNGHHGGPKKVVDEVQRV